MLGARETHSILPIVKSSESAKIVIVMIFTLFFLFYPGIEAAYAKTATSIEELNRQIKNNDKTISRLNSNLIKYQKELKGTKEELEVKRDSASKKLGETENTIRKYNLRVVKLERDANVLQEQLLKLRNENIKLTEKFESQNVLSKSMARSAHNEAIKANESKIELIQLDLAKVNKALASTHSTLKQTNTILDSQKRMSSLYDDENSPNILKLDRLIKNTSAELRKEKKSRQSNVASLERLKVARATKKPKKVKTKKVVKKPKTKKTNQTWVYVINGRGTVNLSNELDLKDWVKSFGAKYIEINWASYSDQNESSSSGFYKRFKSDLGGMPKSNKLVIIGHGLGGSAAIIAATNTAYKKGRTVDLLAVLDPVGDNGLRANIVYQPPESCVLENYNAGIVKYFSCVDGAKPRIITPNVKYFYNRWQKSQGVAADQMRQYNVSDDEGNISTMSSVTGRLLTSKNTIDNQKRFLKKGLSGDENHLVTGVSKELANILAPYLQ